jgi:RNA polymerase sigma factor (sigma-70 family)
MNEQLSLTELIDRVKSGDEASATALVRQYEPELRRYVRYRLTDARLRLLLDSLDVTQSVFARFFVALENDRLEVTNSRQFVKLLHTMATNRLRDHVRRKNAAKRATGGPQAEREPLETVPTTVAAPDAKAETVELVELLRSHLGEMDQAILDKRLQGEEWREIAAKFGGTPDALRKRLSRAIDEAARQLELVDR